MQHPLCVRGHVAHRQRVEWVSPSCTEASGDCDYTDSCTGGPMQSFGRIGSSAKGSIVGKRWTARLAPVFGFAVVLSSGMFLLRDLT